MATAKIVQTDPDVELVIRGRTAANLKLLLSTYIDSGILDLSELREIYEALYRIEGDLPDCADDPFKGYVFIHEDEIG